MVYLDSAAAKKPKFFAKDYYYFWGNPNSQHFFGAEAREKLDEARERIKLALGVKSGIVVFGRSSTEVARAIADGISFYEYYDVSPFEHDAIANCKMFCVRPDEINESSNYFCQYVNNVTGAVFDIEKIGSKIKNGFLVSDFTSAIGRVEIPSNLESFCDAVFFSGRKIGAEGMAAAWLSDSLYHEIKDDSGPQNEYGILPGTMNVGGAIALSYALEYSVKHCKNRIGYYNMLYDRMVNGFSSIGFENISRHENYRMCRSINAVTLNGVDADSLCRFLSSKGVCVSHGYSACSTEPDYRALRNFGYNDKECMETIRVSFDEDTKVEHIDSLVSCVKKYIDI